MKEKSRRIIALFVQPRLMSKVFKEQREYLKKKDIYDFTHKYSLVEFIEYPERTSGPNVLIETDSKNKLKIILEMLQYKIVFKTKSFLDTHQNGNF